MFSGITHKGVVNDKCLGIPEEVLKCIVRTGTFIPVNDLSKTLLKNSSSHCSINVLEYLFKIIKEVYATIKFDTNYIL